VVNATVAGDGESPDTITYRREFSFPASPDELWEALEHPERFEAWWGWLGELRVERDEPHDGHVLQRGTVLHGVVSPPLPYRMRLRVVLEACRRPHHIDAAVHGDLEGAAHLVLAPEGTGTRAEVRWSIEMMQRPMRIAARVAPRLLRWGHDRVVEATVAGFRRHLNSRPGESG
jgi:uncharacterized protein YndB with AHSA1/START domain